ncbi:MAG: DUF3368 domain-containing protein [Leptospiraceae bacterium]|nr:DUF3368 domain-containing protein [Leptospiraceae bacterium]
MIIVSNTSPIIAKNVYGLNVIGTSGILLKAKESGIVKEISPIFQELKK